MEGACVANPLQKAVVVRGLIRVVRVGRALVGPDRSDKLTPSRPPVTGGRGMVRRVVVFALVLLTLAASGLGVYSLLCPNTTPSRVSEPAFVPSADPLPQTDAFADLARTDPVGMFDACLARYSRETKGFRATLEKQERVAGKVHEREVVRVVAWGDVPSRPGAEPKPHVRMVWEQGARKDLFGTAVTGSLYVAGENDDQIVAFRPHALVKSFHQVDVKGSLARGASRYCIRDSGLYRGTLRSYLAWKKLRDAGDLKTEYLGKQVVAEVGGRECHVVRRVTARPNADSFALDEQAATNPKTVERDGFTEVTVMIDAERWLQVGTVLKRPDGGLVGEYYFRDIELIPGDLPVATFTVDALKAAAKH